MHSRTALLCLRTAALLLALTAGLAAAELPPIPLPAPQTSGGQPLLQVIRERSSHREFAPDPLPPQVLSNLLWAAWGINRPATGGRTAPSARNRQEMDVYAATTDGVFLYQAKENRLQPVTRKDLRALTGVQDFVAAAPVNLIYVSRSTASSLTERAQAGGIQAGLIAENVYLFCASEGLATVVRASLDGDALAKALQLPPGQTVILVQTVGYPRKR